MLQNVCSHAEIAVPYSYQTFAGGAAGLNLAVSIPFLLRAHVSLYANYDQLLETYSSLLVEGTNYNWVSDASITLLTATAGEAITLKRKTPTTDLLVGWADGSNVDMDDLLTADRQNLYAVQEQEDASSLALANSGAALSQVAGALLYTPIGTVAGIPATPTNGQRIEISDSTGIQSFSLVTGRPSGFVGANSLVVRLVYTTTGNTWQWVDYRPRDPDGRYGTIASVTAASTAAAAAQTTANTANTAAAAAQSFTQAGTGAVARTVESKLRDVVSVKDFGAAGNGVANDTTAFNTAAAAASSVIVPKGTYLISSATSSSAWQLEQGAIITGLPNKGTAGGGVQDTSRLTGSVVSLSAGGINALKVGDSDPWLTSQRDTVDYLSTFMSVSQYGGIAGGFATRSSDNPTPNMQTIGVGAFAVNDNAANPEPSWCIYTEAIRHPNTGPAFGAEMDFVNLGNTFNLTPYSAVDPYNTYASPTANLWLSVGGGDSGLAASSNNISAAIVLLPNIKKFNNGIVIRNDSIETSNIVVAPEYYKYTWNDPLDRIASTLDHRQHYRAVYSSDINLAPGDITRKYKANGTSPTVLGEGIFSSNNEGFDGTSNFQGTGVNVVQETNFASGSARFRYMMSARNADGGFTVVGLNYGDNATFSPSADNNVKLGTGATRWGTIYSGTSAINTSDARLKQNVVELSEKEQLVAKELKTLIRRFKFKDSVQEKGSKARYHVGIIAQDVVEAFSSQGLDATEYGILCYDEWEDRLDIHDNEGNVLQKGQDAGNIYGIRYEELFAFIISAL